MRDTESGMSRRRFMQAGTLAAGGTAVASAVLGGSAAEAATARPRLPGPGGGASGWGYAEQILRRVQPPAFPDQEFPITSYGAVGNGTTDSTAAIAAAIAACSLAGGGHVVVPAGTFLTGAIHLRSNVDLHLEKGATLRFSTDPGKYLPVVFTRWQGIEFYNYSPFIYAFTQENIGITGQGTLDGQASSTYWWPWKGETSYGWQPGQPSQEADWDTITEMARNNVPVYQRVFGAGHYIRPVFIQPFACRNVVISGVTILNSPNWEIVPELSCNVTVDGITIESLGPNNDGCDVESCQDVVIQNCTFNTGDDCIALKAGRDTDARRVSVPCRDVVIQNCHFANGHGGVTIGSEMTAGVANVYARNIKMTSPNIDDAVRLKTNARRGGYIRNINVKDVTVSSVKTAGLHINYYYGSSAGYDYKPDVQDINLTNVTVGTCEYAVYLDGFPDDHIKDVTLTNCTFASAAKPNVIENADNVRFRAVTINGQPVSS
ncbi:MAG TPA: glycoside hydrolase family 28 protein [Streptosporangiaceae bacterium]|nr:glycoside hydrolase family 28 protein [Streptosporangiaceae bacterium]